MLLKALWVGQLHVSQFEFVSVGAALVYSFAVARLLAGLPFALASGRRHWLHLAWVAVLMLALVGTWWQVWRFRATEWNPVRFIWLLSIPALIYLRIGVLLSQAPGSVVSWRDHYYQARIPFFVIGLLIAANSLLLPWVMGLVPWFAPSWHHVFPLFLLPLYITGLATDRPRIHAGLGVVNLLALALGLVAATWLGDRAT